MVVFLFRKLNQPKSYKPLIFCMNFQRILFVCTLCCVTLPLVAQKYSNEFLAIGVGARAQAMGNSVGASTSDVYASYWNPAGLTQVSTETGLQIGAMHSEWFAGVGKFDFIGLVLPASNEKRRLAISFTRFGVDNIPNTLQLYDPEGGINYDNIFEFSSADYAFLGSYAQKMNVKKGELSVGGNVKVIRRVIGTFANAWGFGLDLAAQYRLNNLRVGLVGRDITTTFNAWKTNFSEADKQVLLATGNDLPQTSSTEITKPSLLMSLGYQFKFGEKVILNPELSAHLTTDGRRNTLIQGNTISIDPAAGVELAYNSFIYLRAGVNQFQREKDFDNTESLIFRPSIGVGLKISSLNVDYAYTDLGDSQNRFSHVISLALSLKPKSRD